MKWFFLLVLLALSARAAWNMATVVARAFREIRKGPRGDHEAMGC